MYLNLNNYSANFDENCKTYSKEVLIYAINGIITSDDFSRSYDDKITIRRHFFGTQGSTSWSMITFDFSPTRKFDRPPLSCR